MGAVYLAEHPRLARKVAIKVLARQLSADAQLAARFASEARAVTLIDHPNVIEVYDFGELADGRLYYSMAVLEGCELTDVITGEGKMSAAQIWPYLEQICAGLQAAHDQGIVHRDLKPENIFVLDREPLAVKLLDFGIARLAETQPGVARTGTGLIMGTPLYIAPEQAAGQPEKICPQTDLYALGVMLFWMLAGRPPFTGNVAAMLLAKHISEAAPSVADFAPETPAPIAALLAQCLAKEPSQRPASAAALAAAFCAGLEGAPLAAADVSALGATLPPGGGMGNEPGLAAAIEAPATAARAPARAPSEVYELVVPSPQQTTMSSATGQLSTPPIASVSPARRAAPLLVIALLVGVGVSLYLTVFREPAAVKPPSVLPTTAAPIAPDTAAPLEVDARPRPKPDLGVDAASRAVVAKKPTKKRTLARRRKRVSAAKAAAKKPTAKLKVIIADSPAAKKPPAKVAPVKPKPKPGPTTVGPGTLGIDE